MALDPYARPSDELSETEQRILAAAFAASALSTSVVPRAVPIVLNRPVLLSENDKSDVLVVSVQSIGLVGLVRGLVGSQSTLFAGTAPLVTISAGSDPFQQILLPRERLWFVPTSIGGTASLSVTEVTP